jgi:hypothetical protein
MFINNPRSIVFARKFMVISFPLLPPPARSVLDVFIPLDALGWLSLARVAC